MYFSSLAGIAALASVASAHYTLIEPYWRGSSFDGNASQWVWPCAGVPQTDSQNNRTAWPLTGGSVKAEFGHEWAITYINLGIGNVVTAFNVTLVDGFNQTGSGEFCISEVGRNALAELDIQEGTNASIQVIQIAHSGASLYNCADITFTKDAKILDSEQCKNGTGVGGSALVDAASVNQESDSEGSTEGQGTGAGASLVLSPIALAAAVVGGVALVL